MLWMIGRLGCLSWAQDVDDDDYDDVDEANDDDVDDNWKVAPWPV